MQRHRSALILMPEYYRGLYVRRHSTIQPFNQAATRPLNECSDKARLLILPSDIETDTTVMDSSIKSQLVVLLATLYTPLADDRSGYGCQPILLWKYL